MKIMIYVITTLIALYTQYANGAMNVHGRLVEELLSDYSTIAPPRININDSVHVSMQISLFQLNEINEKSQYLQIVASLNMFWNDEFMTWEPSSHEGVKYTHIPSDQLWTPDVSLLNSVDDSADAFDVSSFTEAKIDYQGNVTWMMPVMLRSSCEIEVSYYPFDRQVCKLKFISWTHNAHEINITSASKTITTTSYQDNPQWELISTKCEHKEIKYPCCPELFSLVTCQLVTERRPLFYLYNLVFPSFLLMLIGGLVFRVPPESGEKISLAVTVLLAITVYMMVVMDNVPENSQVVPLIQKFIGITVVLLTLSTMLSVGLVKCQFQSYEDERPSRLTRIVVLNYIARLVLFKVEKEDDPSPDPHEQQGALLSKEKEAESPTHANGGNHLGKEVMATSLENIPPEQHVMIRIMQQQTDILRQIQKQSAYNIEESPEERRAKNEWMRIVAIMDRLFFGLYFITVFIVVIIFMAAVWRTKEDED